MSSDIPLLRDGWQQCFERWLHSRRSLAMQRAYAADVNVFFAYTGCAPEQVGPAEAKAWAEYLAAHFSPATVCRRLAVLSSFYRYAPELGMEIGNPFEAGNLRPRLSSCSRLPSLSLHEMRSLLAQIELRGATGWRNLALLLGLFIVAWPVSQWVGLRARDVHVGGALVYCEVPGRGGKGVRQAIPLGLWRIWQRYLMLAGRWPLKRDEFVFTARHGQPLSTRYVGELVRRYGRAAGIDEDRLQARVLCQAGAQIRRARNAGVRELEALLGLADPPAAAGSPEEAFGSRPPCPGNPWDVPADPLGEQLVRDLLSGLL